MIFSSLIGWKISHLSVFSSTFAVQPHPAARYFQTSFRRSRPAGVLLLGEDCRRPPNRGDPVSFCLESAVSADSFSPQGVQSVGPRLFENLMLKVVWECRSHLGSYFQTRPMHPAKGA
jgi:hypothetical protein